MRTVLNILNRIKSVLLTASLSLAAINSVHAKNDSIDINIIISPNSSYQSQMADTLRYQLATSDISSSINHYEDLHTLGSENVLYVAIGQAAINHFHEQNINAPLLQISNTVTPDTQYSQQLAHLSLAQQECREIEFIKALNQNWKSIAILSNTTSVDKATALTKCAIKYRFHLSIYSISNEKELASTLEEAVENNDTILAIADPLIYNRHTIKNILLTAYRNNCPIIGYSESFVNAGAIAGIYTSPNSAGEYAADIIFDYIKNNQKFDKSMYFSDEFTIKTNRQVIRSLDITLPPETDIRQTMTPGNNQE